MKPVYIKIDEDGNKYYFSNKAMTICHREDGPAVECTNGSKFWYVTDVRHRVDGPAIEWADGTKEWYVAGKRHRVDGPAIEDANGAKFWYVNGKLHREDGPAIEWSNGDKSWYVNGVELSEKEFNKRTKPSCEGKVIEVDGKKYKLTAI